VTRVHTDPDLQEMPVTGSTDTTKHESRHGDPTVECLIKADPAQVFATLSDGWTYPLWVVGATHMRAVDPHWPAVGACLHHSVGVWPFALEDQTEVLEVEEDRRLVLRAYAWPIGSARIEIELRPAEGGTVVAMAERAISGPGKFLPSRAQYLMLRQRNVESLSRLRAVVENRGRG
jgi:uncharacterized protein YndB with AHSA1/START domain